LVKTYIFVRKFIAVANGGRIEIHGSKGSSSNYAWTRLAETANIGSKILKLADPVAAVNTGDNKGNPTTIFSNS
jgi:murein L,D-transpeptidase YafK